MPSFEHSLIKDSGLEGESYNLHDLDKKYGELGADLYAIAHEFNYAARTQRFPRYSIDFDVLYPTLNWLPADPTEADQLAFWSSLIFDLPGLDLVIFPGALYEILRFSENKLAAVNEVAGSQIRSAFLHAFAETRNNYFNTVASTFPPALREFRRSTITEQDYFLLSVLKDRVKTFERELPDIDRTVFLRSIQALSWGSRSAKIINNRVDAYNFSLFHALNQRTLDKREDRYILVSRSPSVHRLDKIFPNNYSQTFSQTTRLENVWSPRRAAIFQMIALAGGDPASSARYSWHLLDDIRTYRARIARALATDSPRYGISQPDTRPTDPQSQNVFLRLVSSFEAIQEKVDLAKRNRQKSIDILQATYNPFEAREFFTTLSTAVKSVLGSSGYRFQIESYLPPKDITLAIRSDIAVQKMEENRQIDVVVRQLRGRDEIVFSYFPLNEHFVVVTYGNVSVSEFMDLYYFLRTEMLAKQASGVYSFEGSSSEEAIILRDGDEFIEIPVEAAWDEGIIDNVRSEIVGRAATFIKIITGWFNITYEGNSCSFSSSFPLVGEVASFTREMCPVRFSGGNYEAIAERLLSRPVASLVP